MLYAADGKASTQRNMVDFNYDVVILGGGAMGSATAYFLARLSDRSLKVAVVEPDPTYARAATALAAGGIRQQFSTPENIVMSQYGYGFLSAIGDILQVDREAPDVGLAPTPYLRLVGPDRREALEQTCRLQRSFGAGSTLMEPEALAERFPWLNVGGVAGGVLGGAGEGLFDPYSMLQAFRRKAIAMGVTYVKTRAIGFELGRRNRRIELVELNDGDAIVCGSVVNAAGPRAAAVAALAGVELPITPAKAHTFAFQAERPVKDCPVVLDQVGGVQLKPEGDLFVCAAPSGERADPPDEDDFDPDPELFEQVVWPRLAARVPQFASLKLTRAWVGHVERCVFDGNPIIGPHPKVENLFFINGFSGHGVQHAPAAGRAAAELIVFGAYRSIDLSRFAFERIAAGRRVVEEV
jgi:FAD-dependent oxidoreductase domain-containing protein 1